MVHYQDAIKNMVALSRSAPHISENLRAKLMAVFGNAPEADLHRLEQ
jgi:hypothetical protein